MKPTFANRILSVFSDDIPNGNISNIQFFVDTLFKIIAVDNGKLQHIDSYAECLQTIDRNNECYNKFIDQFNTLQPINDVFDVAKTLDMVLYNIYIKHYRSILTNKQFHNMFYGVVHNHQLLVSEGDCKIQRMTNALLVFCNVINMYFKYIIQQSKALNKQPYDIMVANKANKIYINEHLDEGMLYVGIEIAPTKTNISLQPIDINSLFVQHESSPVESLPVESLPVDQLLAYYEHNHHDELTSADKWLFKGLYVILVDLVCIHNGQFELFTTPGDINTIPKDFDTVDCRYNSIPVFENTMRQLITNGDDDSVFYSMSSVLLSTCMILKQIYTLHHYDEHMTHDCYMKTFCRCVELISDDEHMAIQQVFINSLFMFGVIINHDVIIKIRNTSSSHFS